MRGYISHNGNLYSVPMRYCTKKVWIEIVYGRRMKVYDEAGALLSEFDLHLQKQTSRPVHRGDRGTRRELYLMAMQLIADCAGNNPFKRYYQRLLAGNPIPKLPKVPLGYVVSKLVTVMYVCMCRREPCDANKLFRHMGVRKVV